MSAGSTPSRRRARSRDNPTSPISAAPIAAAWGRGGNRHTYIAISPVTAAAASSAPDARSDSDRSPRGARRSQALGRKGLALDGGQPLSSAFHFRERASLRRRAALRAGETSESAVELRTPSETVPSSAAGPVNSRMFLPRRGFSVDLFFRTRQEPIDAEL